MILLQLPLRLLVSILNGKNTSSSPITWTTSSLAVHSWLFIEIELNEFAFAKSDKIVKATKNNLLTNLNILIYTMLFFFIKYFWMSLISSTSVAS